MPSSTSNSSSEYAAERAPEAPWLAIFIAASVAWLTLLFGLNQLWVARGHVPSVSDSKTLWAIQRRLLTHDGSSGMALVGTSRLKLGIAREEWQRKLPDTPVRMLAAAGTFPLATLRDLGDDVTFRGGVIVDVTLDSLRKTRVDDQQPYVDFARSAYPHQMLDPIIAGVLQSNATVFQSHLSLDRTLKSLVEAGRLPTPTPVRTEWSRFSKGRFANRDLPRASSDSRPPRRRTPPRESVTLIRDATRKIQSRGGRVILVHLPTRLAELPDAVRAADAALWHEMANQTGAVAIHFDDLRSIRDLRCPDGQHLDADDAVRFTAAFLDACVID